MGMILGLIGIVVLGAVVFVLWQVVQSVRGRGGDVDAEAVRPTTRAQESRRSAIVDDGA